MRCQRPVVFGTGNRRRQHEQPRLFTTQRLIQRHARQHIGVQRLRHGRGPLPDIGADLRRQIIVLIIPKGIAQQPLLQAAHDVAVIDAAQRQINLGGVHRLDRDRDVAQTGQHIGAAGEADSRRAVADIEGQIHRTGQNLAARRWQTLPQHDPVAAAMGHAIDAKLAIVDRHHQLPLFQLHEGAVIGARLDQILAENGTNTGRRAVAFDLRIDDAEPVFADGIIQRGLCRGIETHRLRQPQRRNHRAAPALILQRRGHFHRHRTAGFKIGRAQVRHNGGRQDRPLDPGLVFIPGKPGIDQPINGAVAFQGDQSRRALGKAGVGLRPVRTAHKFQCGIQIAAVQEFQIGHAGVNLRQHGRIGGENAPRNCPVIGGDTGNFALGKTSVRTLVEGKRLAGVVTGTGGLAGLQGRVENIGKVRRHKIDAAFINRAGCGHRTIGKRRPGGQDKEKRRNQSEKRAAHDGLLAEICKEAGTRRFTGQVPGSIAKASDSPSAPVTSRLIAPFFLKTA